MNFNERIMDGVFGRSFKMTGVRSFLSFERRKRVGIGDKLRGQGKCTTLYRIWP